MAKKASKDIDTDLIDVAAPSLDDRLNSLQKAATKLTERWGLPDAVATPGIDIGRFQKRVYPTGLLSLDDLLKTGGLPRGHITELYGSPHAGKSLLLYHIIREVQYQCTVCQGRVEYCALSKGGSPIYIERDILVKGKLETVKIEKRMSTCEGCSGINTGGLFVLFDQENSFDPVWAEKQGIELTKFVVMKLPTGEQALDMLRMVMNQHHPDGIGIDSIAQLQPATEQERSSVDDPTMMGLHAKIMSQLCRHVTASFLLDPTKAPLFVWVNQLRADVSGNNALKVTGGYAPEFYSSIRIYMLRRGLVNQQHPEQGTQGRITIKKCKAAEGVTNRTVDYVILDSGFDIATDMYQTAVNKGVFLASALGTGRHYWAEDLEKTNLLASKRDEAVARIASDETFATELRNRVLTPNVQLSIPAMYVGDLPTAIEEIEA